MPLIGLTGRRFVKGYLVRIGVDQVYGRWNAPVDPATGEFVYVPIPDGDAKLYALGLKREYGEFVAPLSEFSRRFPDGHPSSVALPRALLTKKLHLDPDFDYLTYGMMLYVFDAWTNPALFQTGWFVESLLTQTLIIHIIRTAKIPFIQSHASPALITTTAIICLVGVTLPFSWVGSALGFVPLPFGYWPLVACMLLTYASLTHLVKVWFIRRWGI